MRISQRVSAWLTGCVLLCLWACGNGDKPATNESAAPASPSAAAQVAGATGQAAQSAPSSAHGAGPRPTILLSQAQFTEVTDETGETRPEPGAARLVILRKLGDRWEREIARNIAMDAPYR